MKFNGVELTVDAIVTAHESYAENLAALIEEVETGDVFVNPDYHGCALEQWKDELQRHLRHDPLLRSNFTFCQRAYSIQCGEELPFF